MIELPELEGLVVAFVVPGDEEALGSWLHVRADGGVIAYCGKVEVGQNVRTSLAQIVAEELRVPVDRVSMVMGDTARTPFDIGTLSSLTTRTVGTQLRRVAAVARERLAVLADGHDSLRGVRLTATVTRTDAPRSVADWTVAGSPTPKVGARDLVTGAHRFTSDLVVDGMRCGAALRSPSPGAELVSADTEAVAAMPGVTVVRDGGIVGVTARDDGTARRALAAITARWTVPDGRDHRSADLRSSPIVIEGPRAAVSHATGCFEAGWAAADRRLRRSYGADNVAHAPMEPRAALARWHRDELTVWTGTQRPFAVRAELARALDVPDNRVRVIVPDTGSAFGGKHTGEAAIEAARLARAAGCPVRVTWSRADEFAYGYYRPAAAIDVEAGARDDGTLTAWRLRSYNAGPESIDPPYRIPARDVAYQPAATPVRQGPYRALGATANTFARETHLDELAFELGIDPLELRRRNTDDERLVAVLEAAAEAIGWEDGHDAGLACGVEKGGYVATCAEVSVGSRGDVRVLRVAQAFDCGAVINPLHLRGQIEGAIIQGLGGALFESVAFADGRCANGSFSQYRVPRFSDVPDIEVIILNRGDIAPAGAGESPIIAIAPAVGNAIFRATGVRLRALPLAPAGVGNVREDHVPPARQYPEPAWRHPAAT